MRALLAFYAVRRCCSRIRKNCNFFQPTPLFWLCNARILLIREALVVQCDDVRGDQRTNLIRAVVFIAHKLQQVVRLDTLCAWQRKLNFQEPTGLYCGTFMVLLLLLLLLSSAHEAVFETSNILDHLRPTSIICYQSIILRIYIIMLVITHRFFPPSFR